MVGIPCWDIGVYNYMYLIMYDSAQMQCYI